jgi:mannose-1-phosphate guanylyltransferase
MPSRAMVFAAGLGTRLRPLTEYLPKPAIPVLHRPLCWYALDHLRRSGVEHAVLNLHYLGDALERALASAPPLPGLEIALVREERLLGTGGGLRNAARVQSERLGRALAEDELFVAFNGDILFAPDLERAVAVHRALGAIATMVLRADPAVEHYGPVEVDGAGRVRRILGEPRSHAGSSTALVFTGVHVLSARAIEDLPEQGCIIRQGYQRWLARGEVVAGVVDGSPWRDLGTPHHYLAANLELATGILLWPGVDPAQAIDPRARLDGSSSVDRCVVGPGATIFAGVRLSRCVVWPGVEVRRSARNAVLFPGGALEVR